MPLAIGILGLALSVILFLLATQVRGNEDLPTMGGWHLLPAVLLGTVGVLAVLRPQRAGTLLLAAAAVLPVAMWVVGEVAVAIDPAWREIAAGPVAVALWFVSLPAAVTGALLWIAPGLLGSGNR